MITFNKPFLTGKETEYIQNAVASGKISGDGIYTRKCHSFMEARYGFKKALLTTSCTDALEMAAILLDVQPGDEIIMPAYTFVSTANAFVLRGANIIFADSNPDNPNLDIDAVEVLITPRTKVIVAVHYAGIACDMQRLMNLANKHGLWVVEDAAQAIESFCDGQPLGTFGHLAAFSFHETKNIISGEGGLLAINDERFVRRAEIIREKGTNRSEFFRGEIDKYGWVDIGSSFLPSDIIAAFLFAQLENIDVIQKKRISLWERYYNNLSAPLADYEIHLPYIPSHATNNAHMFYLVCQDLEQRSELIAYLKERDIQTVFHYLSLETSPYYATKHDGRHLYWSNYYADRLVRLPMYYDLELSDVDKISQEIVNFFRNK
jgi:dTDP-4-amino-4,6-dideoxygalactose transaminase